MRIYSWNVNGLRAVLRKGALKEFIIAEKPDIICLQEIKAKPEQIDIPDYAVIVNSANRPGYSGTAILFPSPDLFVENAIRWTAEGTALRANSPESTGTYIFGRTNLKTLDSENNIAVSEGRVLVLDMGNFYLVNVYVPNSKPDLSRLKLRETEWDLELLRCLKELEKEKPVVACGDFNVAHAEIDLARPKANHHNAGFTNEERRGMTNYINAGLIDVFRALHPREVKYTWWSHWGKARENNIGWRIDYFLASQALMPKIKSAEIHEQYGGSDHCPISIELGV